MDAEAAVRLRYTNASEFGRLANVRSGDREGAQTQSLPWKDHKSQLSHYILIHSLASARESLMPLLSRYIPIRWLVSLMPQTYHRLLPVHCWLAPLARRSVGRHGEHGESHAAVATHDPCANMCVRVIYGAALCLSLSLADCVDCPIEIALDIVKAVCEADV
jgi:hypothetical protein